MRIVLETGCNKGNELNVCSDGMTITRGNKMQEINTTTQKWN